MTPYVAMKSLIIDGFSRVMSIRQGSADAAKFIKWERRLMEQHPEDRFLYMKILKHEGHNLMVPQAFPNLFRAATAFKRKREGTFKYYRTMKELKAEVTKQEVEDALQEPPFKKAKMTQLDYGSLKVVYGMTSTEIDF